MSHKRNRSPDSDSDRVVSSSSESEDSSYDSEDEYYDRLDRAAREVDIMDIAHAREAERREEGEAADDAPMADADSPVAADKAPVADDAAPMAADEAPAPEKGPKKRRGCRAGKAKKEKKASTVELAPIVPSSSSSVPPTGPVKQAVLKPAKLLKASAAAVKRAKTSSPEQQDITGPVRQVFMGEGNHIPEASRSYQALMIPAPKAKAMPKQPKAKVTVLNTHSSVEKRLRDELAMERSRTQVAKADCKILEDKLADAHRESGSLLRQNQRLRSQLEAPEARSLASCRQDFDLFLSRANITNGSFVNFTQTIINAATSMKQMQHAFGMRIGRDAEAHNFTLAQR